jgi:hypothetical protein
LLELDLSGGAIDNRIRRGRLHREFPGVYSIGRAAVTVYEHSSAAVLACGPGAKLAGESAMCIWGFWTRWPKQPEVVVPGDRRPKGITVHPRVANRPDHPPPPLPGRGTDPRIPPHG